MASKLEELILYVAHKSHDDVRFGATKLNKILFWADFLAFGYWGQPITGAHYIRRQHGPVPKEVVTACATLVRQGRAEQQERTYFGRVQKRLVPLANPDLTIFSPQEIQLVTEVTQALTQETATSVSDGTHQLRPWLDALQEEEIPYHTVFIMQDTPVTQDDKAWALHKLKELQVSGYV